MLEIQHIWIWYKKKTQLLVRQIKGWPYQGDPYSDGHSVFYVFSYIHSLVQFCSTILLLVELTFVFDVSGTKIDLREDKEALQALSDNGHSPIKREQGQKLANKIRAVKYLECSALTQRGLKQVTIFQQTMQTLWSQNIDYEYYL